MKVMKAKINESFIYWGIFIVLFLSVYSMIGQNSISRSGIINHIPAPKEVWEWEYSDEVYKERVYIKWYGGDKIILITSCDGKRGKQVLSYKKDISYIQDLMDMRGTDFSMETRAWIATVFQDIVYMREK